MQDRLGHVDDLKVVLTPGVIAAHAAITYGSEGSWYYTEDGPEWLTVPLALGAVFGMGLFFFLAGAFTPASVARKGVRRSSPTGGCASASSSRRSSCSCSRRCNGGSTAAARRRSGRSS